MYITLLVCLLLVCVTIFFLAYIFNRKKNRFNYYVVLGQILLTLILTIAFPLRIIMQATFTYDSVKLHALPHVYEDHTGSEIIIQHVYANYWTDKIEPKNGRWAWLGNFYHYNAQLPANITEEIELNIPVGKYRQIVLCSGIGCGDVEVRYNNDILYSGIGGETEVNIDIPQSTNNAIFKDTILRVLLSIISTVLIYGIVSCFLIIFSNPFILSLLKRHKVFIGLSVFFIIKVILYGCYPDNLEYPNTYYFMGYEGGFSSRGLLGTIINLILGPYVEGKELAKIKLIALVVSYIFIAYVLELFIKHCVNKKLAYYLVFLIVLSPFTYILIHDNARIDLYLMLIFVAAFLCICHDRLIFLIPVFCFLLMLNNETSCTFFIAPIISTCLFLALRKKRKDYFVVAISSASITVIVMMYFLIVGKLGNMSPTDAFLHARLHTDSYTNYAAWNAESVRLSQHILKEVPYSLGSQLYENFALLKQAIIYFIMILPFVLFYGALWLAIYRELSAVVSAGMVKTAYFLMIASGLCGSICMLIGFDYPRFTGLIMLGNLAMIMTLIANEKMDIDLMDIVLFEEGFRKKWVYYGLLLYASSLGAFDVWTKGSEIINKLQITLDMLLK